MEFNVLTFLILLVKSTHVGNFVNRLEVSGIIPFNSDAIRDYIWNSTLKKMK